LYLHCLHSIEIAKFLEEQYRAELEKAQALPQQPPVDECLRPKTEAVGMVNRQYMTSHLEQWPALLAVCDYNGYRRGCAETQLEYISLKCMKNPKGGILKTLNISDETYELIKGQLDKSEKTDISSLQDMIGKSFFFRTVTYHLTGRVKKIIGNLFVLEDAAWIADSGRFQQAIKNGILSEVEPIGDAILNISTVTDFFPWKHPLPQDQK